MTRRKWIIVGVVVAVLVIGGPLFALANDPSRPEQQTPSLDLASASASKFLSGYVDASGKVRVDNGGETQAQAQAWALLVAAAAGDSTRYNAVLGWTNSNIATNAQSAEVTLDTAWSMAVAAQRLGNPGLSGQANAKAADVINAANQSSAKLIMGSSSGPKPAQQQPATGAIESLSRQRTQCDYSRNEGSRALFGATTGQRSQELHG